jgi:hypothetical protein
MIDKKLKEKFKLRFGQIKYFPDEFPDLTVINAFDIKYVDRFLGEITNYYL